MQLQPADSDSTSYNISFTDNSEEYSYHGVRTSGNGQYVLIFDPVEKHFVLHKIDSTFDMNLISSPWEQDASELQSQYPQLDTTANSQNAGSQRKPPKVTKNIPVVKNDTKRRKSVQAKKSKPAVREPTPEHEDSDDGLTIEYPDAPSSQQYQYQSTPIFQRNVSEDISDEDEDAEGEGYQDERNQDVDLLKLPSPANKNAGGMSDEDIELDLEAELEQALKETAEGRVDESSESEEE